MTVQSALVLLAAIADQLEDITIERDALATILVQAGYSRGDVEHIWSDAKSDPAIRSKARLALSDLRQKLEAAGISSTSEVLFKDTPIPRKSN